MLGVFYLILYEKHSVAWPPANAGATARSVALLCVVHASLLMLLLLPT
jgi:hypothetical protein